MLPYIFLFLSTFILGIVSNKREKKCYAIAVFLIISCFIAFRDITVGPDTHNYVNYFLHPGMGYGNDSRPFEYFYEHWNVFLRHIWENGNFFIFINSFVCLSMLGYVIFNNTKYRIPAFLLIIALTATFTMYLSMFRQCLAVSLFLLGTHFLLRKKYIIVLICFTLSTLSHTSVLLGIVLLPIILRVRYTYKSSLFLIISTLLVALSGILKFDQIFGSFFNTFSSFSYIERYSGYQDQMSEFNSIYFLLKQLLPLNVLIVNSIYFCKKQEVLDNFFVKAAISYVIFNNLMIYSLFTFRILLYLNIFFGLGISILLLNSNRRKISTLVFYLIILAYFWINTNYFSNLSATYAYSTFLL